MRILHLSTSDKGGAGIAAVRLHEALLQQGIQSKLLTLYKHTDTVQQHYQFNKAKYSVFPAFQKGVDFGGRVLKKLGIHKEFYTKFSNKYLKGRPKGFEFFSFPLSEYELEKHPLVVEADIIHLHWISEGFLDYNRFFSTINKKFVWTLHDMNPFTGGCHHSDSCIKYIADCSNCPQLTGTIDVNMAGEMLQKKEVLFSKKKDNEISIITPSAWLGRISKQSLIFKRFEHFHFFNIADGNSFFYRNKSEARIKLGLPADKKIILFVANHINNPRKGVRYLLEAIPLFKTQDIFLCSVGHIANDLKGNNSLLQLGYIMDNETMADVYNAADVFVLPSLAENFPNTIVESLLCGTPVIAFNVGGIPEQINDSNGLIVEGISPTKLSETIDTFFENLSRYKPDLIAKSARKKYDSNIIIEQHLELYKRTINA